MQKKLVPIATNNNKSDKTDQDSDLVEKARMLTSSLMDA